MKGFLEKIAIVFTSLLLSLILFEVCLRSYFHITRESSFNIQELKKESRFIDYAGMGGHEGCTWPDSLYPYPLLGYIQHDLPPCGWPVNSIGTFGKEFSQDPDDYQILFLGGSVAQQISSGFPHRPYSWIEVALNESYYPPKGKRFRIITAAIGGWKQPNQIQQIMKHMKNVNAYISLEGYNEVSMIQNQKKLDEPAFPHFITTSYPDAPSRYKYFSFVRRFLEKSFLGNSYLAIMIFGKLKDWSVASTIRELESSQVNQYFTYPKSMSASEKIELGIRQYLSYLKTMDAITSVGGKKGLIFFQPIPGLYKHHHPNELTQPRVQSKLYLDVENRIGKLGLKSSPVKSLTHIYKNMNDFIYVDDIHAYVDPHSSKSPGYEKMAQEISREIGSAWNLKPRK